MKVPRTGKMSLMRLAAISEPPHSERSIAVPVPMPNRSEITRHGTS